MRTFDHNYPSDITREQFEIIRGDLEGAKKVTKPREIDLYSVYCAILYLQKSGCQWDMLPSNYPKKGIVWHYYKIWSTPRADGSTLLEEVLKKNSGNATKR